MRRTVGYAVMTKDVCAPKEMPLGYNAVFEPFGNAIISNIFTRYYP